MELQVNTWTPELFLELYISVGWEPPCIAQVKKALENTIATFTAYDNGWAVRMVRLIGDGVMSFYIKDFAVVPTCWSIGVATILMNFEPLYLRQFLIIEEYRRRYYGEQAFQMLLSYLKTDSVDIEVLSNNYQGVRFWEKMGFVEGINICDIKIRRNKMQEFNLGIYRANANAKLLSFFEYLYIKLGLKEDEKFVKEYFEIVNENDLIESLNYYIVKNHVTAQITADNYISSITTFYEELYEKYGVTNDIFLNLEMKKRLLKRTKGIITSLRKTESKDVASDEQYETLRNKIIHLPKEQWKNVPIPMRYTTEQYYDVKIQKNNDCFYIELIKEKLMEPISHYPEEYDFPDKLYQEHWEKAYAWGIVEEIEGKQELVACIETCPEDWSNRLMVTELWVHEKLRRKGIGHALMEIAKQQANLEHRRAIILETQSCNVPAISFYLKEGFELIGFDSCCYSNRDIDRKEVRLDMGYFPRKNKLDKDDIIIREEAQEEYHIVEEVTLRAFWNKYHLGCNEHLLIHKIRNSDAYVSQLSRVAEVNGQIVGVICYTKAHLQNGNMKKEILTFGPLCVLPEWQGCGIGGVLLKKTLELARQQGFEGVVIFGEPDYYPSHGFKTCDHFGITTIDGKNFDAFLGIELVEGGLTEFGGKFIESKVFEELSEEENEELTKRFSTPAKQKFPCQWD